MSARRVAWWLLVVALTVATLAATSVGGGQLLVKSRQPPPVVADQPAARQEATQAATAGTVKVLSYSPDTIDQDFDAAYAVLTGDFLSYYRKFTSEIVKPAAQQKGLKTTAEVKRAGVETLTRDAAAILVFVNQTTVSKEQPTPAMTTSSVRVGLQKVHGSWLISRFDAI